MLCFSTATEALFCVLAPSNKQEACETKLELEFRDLDLRGAILTEHLKQHTCRLIVFYRSGALLRTEERAWSVNSCI